MNVRLYLPLPLLLALLLVACESDEKGISSPYQSTVRNLRAEASPGAIDLTWTIPDDPEFSHTTVRYYDFAAEREVTAEYDAATTSLRVENLLHKYGDYAFFFTVYNQQGKAGPTVEIKRSCEPVEAWTETTEKKITLKSAQITTNAREPMEGSVAYLLDDDPKTFFQSLWSSTSTVGYHHLVFDLKRDVSALRFEYTNRTYPSSLTPAIPVRVNLYGSTDGTTWTPVKTLTGLPAENGSTYVSDPIEFKTPSSYLKFEVTETTNPFAVCFSMAEIKFREIVTTRHDPEAE